MTADDLATLSVLNEGILLQELKSRYDSDIIYTYVGEILVAVNPYKNLNIYTKNYQERYKNVKQSDNPPHVYAISDMAYSKMLGYHGSRPVNQSILISGESGAGKTETTKLIIKQLIELSQGHTQLEQQIIQVNPLLEAFGNAQTLMNDNSSRFGRYIFLKFCNGSVKGSKISEYLLEKSRVVRQSYGEENFHVFYYMFAGLEESAKKSLHLSDANLYNYLSDGESCLKNDFKRQKYNYEELVNAMDIVGFSAEEQSNMFTVLAGVLNAGNITFQEVGDGVKLAPSSPLNAVSKLLGFDMNELQSILTESVTFTRGDEVRHEYTKNEAEDCRDAIAKSIYGRLFSWIVNRINCLLVPRENLPADNTQEIGILDIFGFEMFEKNSFEQLCINLANEQLQSFFNKHIFQMEQDEYKREGIDWKEIKWMDNKEVLELLLAKPIGVLALLDEESQFPNGTDLSFVDKLNHRFDHHKYFTKSTASKVAVFTIIHYAGDVTYSTKQWLDKNKDTLPPGVSRMLNESKNALLSLIFKGTMSRTGTLIINDIVLKKRSTKMDAKKKLRETKARKLTVGAQFKNSLTVLMERMSNSEPIFIRCIKPNRGKHPNDFDKDFVLKQLLYTGMLETIKIRREGYAVRPTFQQFTLQYGILINAINLKGTKENCNKVLHRCKISDVKMGKTKVFMKYKHVEILADDMQILVKKIIIMQKVVRGFLGRCKANRRKETARQQTQQLTELLLFIERLNVDMHEKAKFLVSEDNKLQSAKKAQQKSLRINPLPPTVMNIQIDDVTSKFADSSSNTACTSTEIGTGTDGDLNEDQFELITSTLDAGTVTEFGIYGTKDASVEWFKRTQSTNVKLPGQNNFAEWFHGIITRRASEELLKHRPVGCFLIRVSESRFGFTLSFKANDKTRHYMIDQTRSSKYMIVGEPKVHASLHDMVSYYQIHHLSNWNSLLGEPCGQEEGQEDYSDLIVSHEDSYMSIKDDPYSQPASMISSASGILPPSEHAPKLPHCFRTMEKGYEALHDKKATKSCGINPPTKPPPKLPQSILPSKKSPINKNAPNLPARNNGMPHEEISASPNYQTLMDGFKLENRKSGVIKTEGGLKMKLSQSRRPLPGRTRLLPPASIGE